MKAEEISIMKLQTFSATPTPAEAVTPMELTMANIMKGRSFLRIRNQDAATLTA